MIIFPSDLQTINKYQMMLIGGEERLVKTQKKCSLYLILVV